MLSLISPAKTLDFTAFDSQIGYTQPHFAKESLELIKVLRKCSAAKLGELMDISDKLIQTNMARYQAFSETQTPENAKPALLAFKGDVYIGLEAEKWQQADFEQAQKTLRILSGLYGLLRPLDLIQAYRLEMGTQLETKKGKNLYEFWGDKITKLLNEAVAESGSQVLVNLASQEYFQAVNPQKLKAQLLHIHFKEVRNGKLQFVSFNAKKARGMMAAFMVRHRLDKPADLREFREGGYVFYPDMSTEREWLFVKEG